MSRKTSGAWCPWAVLAAALLALAMFPAGALAARDYSSTALNIVPSGQYGDAAPPEGADEQAKLYDGLTPLFGSVTKADLFRYFKPAVFGTKGQGPTRVERIERRGVEVVRDRYNVPHITSRTRDGLTFAVGWVTAQDRGLLLEQARYNARVASVDAPGLRALPLVVALRSFEPSPQTEALVARQTKVLRSAGPRGRELLHDIDVYVSGINAQYAATGNTAKPWGRNDVYALNALLAQFLGQGGGDEARRSMLLDGLQDRFGARPGYTIFNDLRERQNPETPVTLDGRFPYDTAVPARPAANQVLDNGSLDSSAAQASRASQSARAQASNALLLSGKRSNNGQPLFVAGPQIGYFYPGLTMEVDLHGPGVDVRGATAAPFPGYLLIGRGPDFAMSLTSASSDVIDQYVETLCGGSDTKYVYRGRCREMGLFDAGTLKAGGGEAERRVRFRTTVHGPVIGYARVDGRRVAISSKRSTRGRETLFQLTFQDITKGRVHSPQSFFRAVSKSPLTFNAFYADDRDIAMYSAGRLPIRPRGVDPGLPVDGRGGSEWRGFLSEAGHPRQVNPRDGDLVNWNDKPARGFAAADDRFAYGSVQRVELLTAGIDRRRKHDLASVTAAMNRAATQDVRVMETWPSVSAVLATGEAPTPRAAEMARLLDDWRRAGGSRLDRELDGTIDHPGAAIMDAAWPRLANAVMRPVLGPGLLEQLDSVFARTDRAPSGFFGGWNGYVDKDLRTLLGRPVKGKYRTRFCGAGGLDACRADLWAALDEAGAELEAAQGPTPAAWRQDANAERISFAPGLLKTTIRYTNRPSGIQQVISFDGHRPRR